MSIEVETPNLRFSKSQADIMEDYEPFITKEFVSLLSDETSQKPTKILLDMGATRTYLLENRLLLL